MEQKTIACNNIPYSRIFAILIGFPAVSTIISLLLLKKQWLEVFFGNFYNFFWLVITIWYIIQMWIVTRVLKEHGWSWRDIGFPDINSKRLFWLVGGYLLIAFGAMLFIEWTLAYVPVDQEKIGNLSGLTPKTTTARLIFIFMGLVAGLSEEMVYRGFAISALKSNAWSNWVSILLAAIPFVFQHGLKSLDQFWWFLIWGVLFGVMYLWRKQLDGIIVIHWVVILSAMMSILQVVR